MKARILFDKGEKFLPCNIQKYRNDMLTGYAREHIKKILKRITALVHTFTDRHLEWYEKCILFMHEYIQNKWQFIIYTFFASKTFIGLYDQHRQDLKTFLM